MYILAFESSCDETACAVLEMDTGKRILKSNIIASQVDIHALYGGVVPEIASRAHIEAISGITYQALEEAGVSLDEIDAIAVTAFPGLIGALLVGVNFAKSLAYANKIPLVAVNHIHGHVAAAYLSNPELKPPYLALVVSGGHTAFYRVDEETTLVEIGGTRDDAAGEAFDKIGRVIGLPYPGGAALDKLAYEGDAKAIALPSPALAGDTLDFSFSGIKTATLNYLNSMSQKGEAINAANVAAAYTDKIVKAIVSKTEMALAASGMKTLVLAGGVAANSHLRAALEKMCKKKDICLCMPERALCGDNAAMIAAAGYFAFQKGNLSGTSLNASAADDGL